MTTSRIPAVRAALVSIFTAQMPTAAISDGKWVTNPDGDYLTVGWTPENDRPTGHQDWAALGNKARNETIDIPCYADSLSGSTDPAARRAAAFALFGTAETAIRADPTLGGVIPNPGWAWISDYIDYEEQTEAGVEAGVIFHVSVQTRI